MKTALVNEWTLGPWKSKLVYISVVHSVCIVPAYYRTQL